MKIRFYNGSKNGICSVDFERGCCSPFVSKDGMGVKLLKINHGGEEWRMSYCHEVGHILTVHKFEVGERVNTFYTNPPKSEKIIFLKWEVIAWRIAKSFCKEEYWNEAYAIKCLKSYADLLFIKIYWDKFKVIPLNIGI